MGLFAINYVSLKEHTQGWDTEVHILPHLVLSPILYSLEDEVSMHFIFMLSIALITFFYIKEVL